MTVSCVGESHTAARSYTGRPRILVSVRFQNGLTVSTSYTLPRRVRAYVSLTMSTRVGKERMKRAGARGSRSGAAATSDLADAFSDGDPDDPNTTASVGVLVYGPSRGMMHTVARSEAYGCLQYLRF